MKHLKTMLRMFTVLAIFALFTLPVMAEDLKVYPTETTSADVIPGASLMALVSSDPVPSYTTSDVGIELIISYEGFFPTPYKDVNRYSIGYGCSYEAAKEKYGEDCTSITEEQGMELLKDELGATETRVNQYLTKNSITVNQNQFDALLSFTYNVGSGWLYNQNPDGTPYKIQAMLLDDPATWTEDRAQEAFGSWVNAGGVVLDGLVKRRKAEATLFCTPYTPPEGDSDGSGSGSDSSDDTSPDDDGSEGTSPDGDNASTGNGDSSDTTVPSFSDVAESAWYYDEVMAVCELGLMNGMGGDIFRPEGTLTRAQMVKILANYDGATDLSRDVETGFTDVPSGKWYSGVIAWAVEKGYVNGMGDGTFQPDSPITREQLCTILARYLKDKGFAVGGESTPFADDADISKFAKESVYFCSTMGLIQGMGQNAFVPRNSATRAQAATILLRMCELG